MTSAFLLQHFARRFTCACSKSGASRAEIHIWSIFEYIITDTGPQKCAGEVNLRRRWHTLRSPFQLRPLNYEYVFEAIKATGATYAERQSLLHNLTFKPAAFRAHNPPWAKTKTKYTFHTTYFIQNAGNYKNIDINWLSTHTQTHTRMHIQYTHMHKQTNTHTHVHTYTRTHRHTIRAFQILHMLVITSFTLL